MIKMDKQCEYYHSCNNKRIDPNENLTCIKGCAIIEMARNFEKMKEKMRELEENE